MLEEIVHANLTQHFLIGNEILPVFQPPPGKTLKSLTGKFIAFIAV